MIREECPREGDFSRTGTKVQRALREEKDTKLGIYLVFYSTKVTVRNAKRNREGTNRRTLASVLEESGVAGAWEPGELEGGWFGVLYEKEIRKLRVRSA